MPAVLELVLPLQAAAHEEIAARLRYILRDIQRQVGAQLILLAKEVGTVGLCDAVQLAVQVGRRSERHRRQAVGTIITIAPLSSLQGVTRRHSITRPLLCHADHLGERHPQRVGHSGPRRARPPRQKPREANHIPVKHLLQCHTLYNSILYCQTRNSLITRTRKNTAKHTFCAKAHIIVRKRTPNHIIYSYLCSRTASYRIPPHPHGKERKDSDYRRQRGHSLWSQHVAEAAGR